MYTYMKYSLYKVFSHFPIEENSAYFESHASNDFAGNMYRIAEELLSDRYPQFKIYISLRDPEHLPLNVQLLLKSHSSKNIYLVKRSSLENYYALATAKYLFTDVTLIATFQKRQGQVVVQTWHGTPLKHLGFDYVADVSLTSNQKRSFSIADFVLFPNEYTMNHMISSYRLENTMQGKILLHGYPRNSIFFAVDEADQLRRKLGLSEKTVFIYMPTWRGSINKGSRQFEQTAQLQNYLLEIDAKLDENQVLFAKLHRLNRAQIDFSLFTHILPFPEEYETYQFLALADCLITDYSSVMFDFLCTRKKIVLFAYDQEQYLQEQGMYIPLSSLPFPIVNNVEDLMSELNLPKSYDDAEAYQNYCSYDGVDATAQLCAKIIKGAETCVELEPPNNHKENVLLYCGALTACDTTLNFIRLLDQLDTQTYNFCVTYMNTAFRTDPIRLQCITKPYNLIAIDSFEGSFLYPTFYEKIALKLCENHSWARWIFARKIRQFYRKEFERQFFGLRWKKVVRFGGLDELSLNLFQYAPIKEKYILVYPEMKQSSTSFDHLLKMSSQNGCTLVDASNNSASESVCLLNRMLEELAH